MSILNVEHLTHGFGDRAIFNDVSFRLLKGEHIGLVGANGEGKSTFMSIVTGKMMPDEGKVEWAKNVNVGYLDQHAVLEAGMTIQDALKSAFDPLLQKEERMNEICDMLGTADEKEMEILMEELGMIQDELTLHDFYTIDAKVEEVARALGLGYPGGPKIDKLAKEGNPKAITFPKANFHEETLDFSFSGVKSAVLNYLNKCNMQNIEINKADVAASFQQAVVDVLKDNVLLTCKKKNIDTIAIAGGVASNSTLRETLINEAGKKGIKVLFPTPILCTDNAAMIGSAAYFNFINGKVNDLNLNAKPNLKL